MATNMEAFVYCWTDKITNKLYVGSHKGSPDDGYVCSGKYMLEESKKKMSESRKKNKNIKELASNAGKASVNARPENYKELQSARIKLWWAERKKKIGG
jgi:hypothetical protein